MESHMDKDLEREMERIHSGSTLDSPFGSNLATPTEELDGPPSFTATEYAWTRQTPKVNEVTTSVSMQLTDSGGSTCSDDSPLLGNDAERLGHAGASSLYSMPNSTILLNESESTDLMPTEQLATDVVTPSQLNFATDMDLIDTVDFFESRFPTRDSLPVLVLKVLLFVPWCALVGAAILFSPGSLDLLNSFYFSAEEMKGARRMIHWVEYAPMFVSIFIGCVVLGGIYCVDGFGWIGINALALACGRAAVVWGVESDEDVKKELSIAFKAYVSQSDGLVYDGMVLREWDLDDEL